MREKRTTTVGVLRNGNAAASLNFSTGSAGKDSFKLPIMIDVHNSFSIQFGLSVIGISLVYHKCRVFLSLETQIS